MNSFCDSGYASIEDEVMEGAEETIDDTINQIERQATNSESVTMAVNNYKEESEASDEEGFQEWLRKVAECLQGRNKGCQENIEDVAGEQLSEEERCMRIARSVLDEETVLDMVKTFLKFTKVFVLEKGHFAVDK